jgi:hypothetical protein
MSNKVHLLPGRIFRGTQAQYLVNASLQNRLK